MDMIKVSANSRTSAVAGAIAGVIRENKRAEVQAIGAGAVNQAVKALVLATGYLKNDGINIVCVPEFVEVTDIIRTVALDQTLGEPGRHLPGRGNPHYDAEVSPPRSIFIWTYSKTLDSKTFSL